jgi:enoyl-CoA hydratase/carnithine racemase
MQMILTGDPIDAQAALRYGLVQRVVPRERLYAEAEELARRIIPVPQVVRLIKRAILDGVEMPLPDALAFDFVLAQRALASAERVRNTVDL